MKKHILVLSIAMLIVLLSSCSLFCKHEYEEKLIPSTCVAEGYTEYTCKKCKDSYKENSLPLIQHNFFGAPCTMCGMKEITENITPDTEWYNVETVVFNLTTKEQLAGFASLVNSGTNFSGQIVYLDADIDLGFYEWIPIGNAEHPFNGSFDGDGHTVTGLKINADTDYVGFFGNTVGKISNFTLDRAIVFVKRDHNYASIACGYTTTEISDVSVNGCIEAPKVNSVGAVAGAVNSGSVIYSGLKVNAVVNGANKVGGLLGNINTNGSLQTDEISFNGKVTGESEVGGAVGYAKADFGSKIYAASVCADISGNYYVGGVAGKLDNVGMSDCKNDGSTITSKSYYTEGENFYVWLGGYVGYGFSVENCVNNVDITYNARGIYVGGIIGLATNYVKDCTNNGNITAYTNYVGGIAGAISTTAGSDLTYSNLSNSGNIEGREDVGGIAGIMWYDGGYCNGAYIFANELENTGKVVGEKNVGGVFGNMDVDAPHSCWYNCPGAVAKMIATDLINKGDVSGDSNVGEITGRFWSEGNSTLTGYTVLGKITLNGETLEGEYDIGENTRLTLTDRKIEGQ